MYPDEGSLSCHSYASARLVHIHVEDSCNHAQAPQPSVVLYQGSVTDVQTRSAIWSSLLGVLLPDKYRCRCSRIGTGALVGGSFTIAFSASCLNHCRVMNDQYVLVAYIRGSDEKSEGNSV